jgi:hypothetical protein
MKRALTILGLCLAAACTSSAKDASPSPAPAAPAVAPPAAELARSGLEVVAESEAVLTDPARKRDLTVAATYPGGKGPYPVVVYLPGEGRTGEDDRLLLRFWATRGYAVLAVAPKGAKKASSAPPWDARVRDAAFVVDSLPSIGERIPPLAGKLDAARVGVGGHGEGAAAAGILAGATVDPSKTDKGKGLPDPRPKAFLLISPPAAGKGGWTSSSWAGVARPLLVVAGSRETSPKPKGADATWRPDAFRLSASGDKYCLWLPGGSALSATGQYAEPGAALAGRGKGAPTAQGEIALFKDVKAATIAFWDAFLRGDAAAQAFLRTDPKLERR